MLVVFQKLLSVLDELEGLKPHFQRQIQKSQGTAQTYELDGQKRRQYGSTSSSMGQNVADNGASVNKNDWRVFSDLELTFSALMSFF